ncbi:hypothetical protein L873DRAFT_1824271 [Choiromyces venosus 120613-1]|uniref:Uncharacterized protein n=1 Tax=Choiromyces venosus 120613-1 TaxID=1336337 RepID=A0A3N4IWC9_9PEZI|nr:hypothetical protein L873DRAFT_1824271 [Choiromyces venosus 120613-1]
MPLLFLPCFPSSCLIRGVSRISSSFSLPARLSLPSLSLSRILLLARQLSPPQGFWLLSLLSEERWRLSADNGARVVFI